MLLWYVIMGILTFVIFGHDKYAAVSGRRRTAERILWGLSAAGGVWGGLLAIFVFRHKICKPTFCLVMGLIVFTHVAILLFER